MSNETYLRGLTDEELRAEEENIRFFTDREPPAGRVDPNFLDDLKTEFKRRGFPLRPFGPEARGSERCFFDSKETGGKWVSWDRYAVGEVTELATGPSMKIETWQVTRIDASGVWFVKIPGPPC